MDHTVTAPEQSSLDLDDSFIHQTKNPSKSLHKTLNKLEVAKR